MKNKVIISVVIFSAVVGLAFARSSYADTNSGNFGEKQGQKMQVNRRIPGVFGTISAVNGTNFSLINKGFGPKSATTTYSIDASKAIVTENRATSTLSAISVGKTAMVQGVINGTSVVATKVDLNVGFGAINRQNPGRGFDPKKASSTNMMEGNGQPIIGGTVTTISGTTITITNKGNVSYTIDASNATTTKAGSKIAPTDIPVGDSILVQGTINGTSVIATTVTDQGVQNANNEKPNNKSVGGGFFGGVKNFFSRLFGF